MVNCNMYITSAKLPWNPNVIVKFTFVHCIKNFEKLVIDLADAGWSIVDDLDTQRVPVIANPNASQLSAHENQDAQLIAHYIAKGYIVAFGA